MRKGTPANGPVSCFLSWEHASLSIIRPIALVFGCAFALCPSASSSNSAAVVSPRATSSARPTASCCRYSLDFIASPPEAFGGQRYHLFGHTLGGQTGLRQRLDHQIALQRRQRRHAELELRDRQFGITH